MVDIKVHIDTLEYARDGLRTPKALPLTVGAQNRVILVRPERRKALPLGSGCFGINSCFPTPGVLSLCMLAAAQSTINAVFGLSPKSLFQVYGHAEASGDEADNKVVSDKRANVMLACLKGDFEFVQSIAQDEGWGMFEQQVMLRTLRCDPGAVDGDMGPVTRAAIRLFQYEYTVGVFHRHRPDLEPSAALEQNGDLDDATAGALVEAYVVATSPFLQPAQLHPTHPAAGCSEFNAMSPDADTAAHNRRISLVVHPDLPQHHDAAPCTAGDHEVCPINDKYEHRLRCLWYREHVIEPKGHAIAHRHFDLRWLVLPNGRVLLSALTTLPDDDAITFRVHRTKAISRSDEVSEDNLSDALSDDMQGLIRGGVAQVVWEPPEGLDVLAPLLEPVVIESADDILTKRAPRASLLVFVCAGAGVSEVSGPPGRELVRLPPRLAHEAPDAGGFGAFDHFGHYYQQLAHEVSRDSDAVHPLREAEPKIWLQRHATRHFRGR